MAKRYSARRRRGIASNSGEGSLDLILEAGDQLAVVDDQRVLGFDLGADGLLRGEMLVTSQQAETIEEACFAMYERLSQYTLLPLPMSPVAGRSQMTSLFWTV